MLPKSLRLDGNNGIIGSTGAGSPTIADTTAAVASRRFALPTSSDKIVFLAQQPGYLKIGDSGVDAGSNPQAYLLANERVVIDAVFTELDSGALVTTRATHADFISAAAGAAWAFLTE